jgi:hypothetical protein
MTFIITPPLLPESGDQCLFSFVLISAVRVDQYCYSLKKNQHLCVSCLVVFCHRLPLMRIVSSFASFWIYFCSCFSSFFRCTLRSLILLLLLLS